MDAHETQDAMAFLGDAIAATTGQPTPADNVAERFENDTFIMRSFCWGCSKCDNGDGQCEPNFLHKGSGIALSWYKYNGRGLEWIKKPTDLKSFVSIVVDCINSLNIVEESK